MMKWQRRKKLITQRAIYSLLLCLSILSLGGIERRQFAGCGAIFGKV